MFVVSISEFSSQFHGIGFEERPRSFKSDLVVTDQLRLRIGASRLRKRPETRRVCDIVSEVAEIPQPTSCNRMSPSAMVEKFLSSLRRTGLMRV